jgi:hypothetical protein
MFMSLLAVREQSLNSQFPSHLFGNVELLMLKKIVDKVNNSEKAKNNSFFSVPKVILEKIGEYLDLSKLPLDKFNERWKDLENRFYKMYSYIEDPTGYREIGIRLPKLPQKTLILKQIAKRDNRPNFEEINTGLTLADYNRHIEETRNLRGVNIDLSNYERATVLTSLNADLAHMRAESTDFSKELSRTGTEFQRRQYLPQPQDRPAESFFTDLIETMEVYKGFRTRFIREPLDCLSEQFLSRKQSPSAISQKLVCGPIRSVKKALSRFRPY